MAIAVGIGLSVMGVAVSLLGILCAYVWKGNHKMEKVIMESQKALLDGQERIEMGQERMGKVLVDGFNILEEGQKKGFAILEEGQREIAQILKDHTQMLLAQTRILERIEGKIPAPSVG
jgi:hypothetical protein